MDSLAADPAQSLILRYRGRIIASVIFAVVVLFALGLFGDIPAIARDLARFEWGLIPVILALTLFNYSLRFVKWHYYLGRLGLRVPVVESFFIFLAGLSMAITPGKVGELLKSVLLRQTAGVEMSKTAPIIMAERLTDGVAMLILASAGLAMFHYGWQAIALLVLATFALVGVVQSRRLSLWLLGIGERLPVARKVAHHLRHFYESAYILLRWNNLLLAIAIGVVSWSGECLAFYLVLIGLGIHASFLLLIQATFILAFSTLVGSASLLPGGLGAAETSTAILLVLLVHTGRGTAAAGTLLIRFCTLWFGVAVGLCGLALIHRHMTRAVVRHPIAPAGTD